MAGDSHCMSFCRAVAYMITSLSILLTDRCNISCDHCIIRAKKSGGLLFDVTYLDNLLEGLLYANIPYLGITGGEPLLYPELLKTICKELQNIGITSIVASNAFWASSYMEATKTVCFLKNVGVKKLIMSVDDYHMKYIPLKNISNAVNASNEYKLEYQIVVSALNISRAVFYHTLLAEMEIDNVYSGAIERAGRAKDLIGQSYDDVELRLFKCLKVGHPIVLLNCNVVACCDLLVAPEYEPQVDSPLHLGSIKNEPLKDILNRASHSAVLTLIRDNGPDGIFAKLKDTFDRKSNELNPNHGCKLCSWLFAGKERANSVLDSFREHSNSICG
ncbi:MAG: radical SAM protein [Syntrophobacteraceae bacterium]